MPRKGGVPENLKPMKKGDPPLPGGGRPRKIPSLEKILAEEFGDEPDKEGAARALIKTLKAAALRGKMTVMRAQAAERLADRIWGKAKSNDTLSLRVQVIDEILADEKTKKALEKYGLTERGAQKGATDAT